MSAMTDLGLKGARTMGSPLLPWLVLALLVASAAAAATELTPIELPPDALSAKVHSGIARGETTRYTLELRDDQWVELSLASVEDNAVAQIYGPGWKITADDEVVRGATELQLGGDAGTTTWSDLPPASGRYLVVVGSERGGAEFDLEVLVRAPTDDDCDELSQAPMNRCYAVLAKHADDERAKAYAAFEQTLEPPQRTELTRLEKAWRAFAEAQCGFEADFFRGGSMQRAVYSGCMWRHLRARAAALEELRQREL